MERIFLIRDMSKISNQDLTIKEANKLYDAVPLDMASTREMKSINRKIGMRYKPLLVGDYDRGGVVEVLEDMTTVNFKLLKGERMNNPTLYKKLAVIMGDDNHEGLDNFLDSDNELNDKCIRYMNA